MAQPHYLLSLKFIRETEQDLEKALRADVSALEQYERLIAALAELETEALTLPANPVAKHTDTPDDARAKPTMTVHLLSPPFFVRWSMMI